jgi:predicted nuclease of predicted toxin-antitoxin system
MPNLIPDEIRLLLDENISHTIASRLNEAGIDALPVGHRGMNGVADYRVFQFAQKERRAVATINEYDFRKLASKTVTHCGVAVIPCGGSRDEQYEYLINLASFLRITPPAMVAIQNRVVSINHEMKINSQTACTPAPAMPVISTTARL